MTELLRPSNLQDWARMSYLVRLTVVAKLSVASNKPWSLPWEESQLQLYCQYCKPTFALEGLLYLVSKRLNKTVMKKYPTMNVIDATFGNLYTIHALNSPYTKGKFIYIRSRS